MNEEMFLPIYELNLRSNEPLTSKTTAVPLGHSDSARVRCSLLDSGFDSQTLLLTRNQKNMTYNRHGHSILYTVDKFDSNRGEEIFDCTARRRDGKIQVRSMKFIRSRKPRLSNGDKECESNHCRNGGICLVKPDGASKYCMCGNDYMGTTCEQSFATITEDNINMKTHRNVISGIAIFLLLIAIAIAILYFLERKKTKKLKKIVSQLRRNQNIGSTRSKNDVDLDAIGCEDPDPDLEEIYDQADQKPAIRRPTLINDYDNLKLKPENETGKRAAIT